MTSRNHRVLIAEQREDDRFFLKLVIRKRAPSLEVVGEVSNGEQLTDYLSGAGPFADRAQHPLPDLLIINWRLPLKDGAEMLHWIRAQNLPRFKVAAMTLPAPESDQLAAGQMGVDYIFSKAFNLQDLERILTVLVADLERLA